jgi:predicted GNAT family acetyltransferase
MIHVLDNPAWNALSSGNKNLSNGNDKAKHFPKEVSPFVGMAENTSENFEILRDLMPAEGVSAVIAPAEIVIPDSWKLVHSLKVQQMICETPAEHVSATGLIPLSDQHIPAMLALTKLTEPGPFASRTVDFGHYRGIFNGDQLIAMAGQRLHPYEYMEISAVCTHPDFTGRGLAKQLLSHHIRRIREAGGIPFLHVKSENARAIKVYEAMGFKARREMSFYIIKKS